MSIIKWHIMVLIGTSHCQETCINFNINEVLLM